MCCRVLWRNASSFPLYRPAIVCRFLSSFFTLFSVKLQEYTARLEHFMSNATTCETKCRTGLDTLPRHVGDMLGMLGRRKQQTTRPLRGNGRVAHVGVGWIVPVCIPVLYLWLPLMKCRAAHSGHRHRFLSCCLARSFLTVHLLAQRSC